MAIGKKALQDAKAVLDNMEKFMSLFTVESKERAAKFKEKYDFRDAFAFNMTAVMVSDNDLDPNEEKFLDDFLKMSGSDKKSSYFTDLFFRKKSEEYIMLNTKYGHIFEGDNNIWMGMATSGIETSDFSFVGEIVGPYTEVLKGIARIDGVIEAKETEYIMAILDSITKAFKAVATEFKAAATQGVTAANTNISLKSTTGEHFSEELPLNVSKVGGTIGSKDHNGTSISLGIDATNPNPNKLAYNVTVEISLTDSNGNIVEVINDTIYVIDPNTTFHYGCEKRYIQGMVSSISSASAFAEEFMDVAAGKKYMDGGTFSNFNLTKHDNGCKLTGHLESAYQKSIRNCYVYFQILDENGDIKGGNNTNIGVLPARQTRAIQFDNKINLNGKHVEYSIDFELNQIL